MSVIEVAIGPGVTQGTYKVDVVNSPAGEASATVELTVDALLARRDELQQALLASGVSARRLLPETERPVREIGQALFTSLLGTGSVAGRYRASVSVAEVQGQALRVVLRIETPELAGLPWEAMFDGEAGAYVCQQDQLVRHVPVASVPAPLAVDPPVRILGLVSSPAGLRPLDVDKEKELLERALARPVDDGLVQVHWAPSATWDGLHDLLMDGPWHVLHFIGHGGFDPHQDEGVLALTGASGRADLVAAHRFAGLLRQARPMPRLVVLNSCSGAQTGVTDLFSGTGATLVRSGVSAVAAMQYAISDGAAVAFARGFYTAIARGRGVDEAVSSGRVAIAGLSGQTLEWVTPVLYLRGAESRLFTMTAMPALGDPGRASGDPPRSASSWRLARRAGAIGAVGAVVVAVIALSWGPAPASHAPAQSAPAGSAPASPTPAGPAPASPAAAQVRAIAYVIDNDGDADLATPINLATARAGAPIRITAHSYGVAITADGKTAYVTDTGHQGDGHTVTPIDLTTGRPGTPIKVGKGPYGIAITPDGKTAYITNVDDGTVTPIDLATRRADAPIRVGKLPYGIAITPDGTTAYVTNDGDGTVTPIDLATGRAGTPIQAGDGPAGIAITPDGTTAYVADYGDGNGNGNTVTPIDLATRHADAPIQVGKGPAWIAITPDGSTAYVTNYGNDNGNGSTVTPIDLATGRAETPIKVAEGPGWIVITPDGKTAYVTDSGYRGDGDTVLPIDLATNRTGTPIKVGKDPKGIAITERASGSG